MQVCGCLETGQAGLRLGGGWREKVRGKNYKRQRPTLGMMDMFSILIVIMVMVLWVYINMCETYQIIHFSYTSLKLFYSKKQQLKCHWSVLYFAWIFYSCVIL